MLTLKKSPIPVSHHSVSECRNAPPADYAIIVFFLMNKDYLPYTQTIRELIIIKEIGVSDLFLIMHITL